MSHAVTSSGLLTATTTVVSSKPATLNSVHLTAAAATSTLIVYDNASAASGTVLATLSAVANTTASLQFKFPVNDLNGLTVIITGTGATGVVHYARTY